MLEATKIDRGFHIAHQKVQLDVDLAGYSITGSTEITVLPSDPTIRDIRLDLRQAKVTAAYINNKPALWDYEDFWQATSSPRFTRSARTVHQYDAYKDKLSPLTSDRLSGELVVHLPRYFKIQPTDSFIPPVIIGRGISPTASRFASPDVLSSRNDIDSPYLPINLRIDFKLENPVMGVNFVKKSPTNSYEHVYTCSNPFGISTSSWLPCVDGLWERCSWQFVITVPKTIGDIRSAATNDYAPTTSKEKEEEDLEREIAVVCIGDVTHEVTHSTDVTRKTVTFDLPTPVAAQHVGFAVGPFIQTNLSALKESDDEEAHHSASSSSVDVLAYSLPGKQDDVINTCMFMNKAMEYFIREYTSYPFGSFSLCFVETALDDMETLAGLSIVSERHLFPVDVIDPLFSVTKYLTTQLAAQWSGVNIVPKNWSNIWVTIGICRYITGMFLKKLMGNNEHRFRLRKDAEKICELDIGRPPIGDPDLEYPIDRATLKFIELKAPVVLHILDRRLTKSGVSFGLTRVIPKLFRQAMMGELTSLSTSHFQRLCEKVSHAKVDTFFQEWVYGSGYPIFRITQRFNKKKMFIEMGIRQVQSAEMSDVSSLNETEFVKDAKRHLAGKSEAKKYPVRSAFTGPMTIRIHEADGTPYEHIVHIKDSFIKIDIQYNTKYKRLKRNLRQKGGGAAAASATAVASAAAAAAAGDHMDEGEYDGVLLHSLGDVLSTDDEMSEWRLTDWTADQEDQMTNEAFEWMRVDSDFEWICMIYINQPDYMYASQLQQDRDVVAQYECIKFFADAKPAPIYSTILARTLMDRRYYYGIRVEAALTLARYATPDLDFIGRYHLLKAFQTIFCFPDSLIPQANDFSDFGSYSLQKAIPTALALVKDDRGKTSLQVKEFLLDLLRYNENSNNMYSDCFYVGCIIRAICNSIAEPGKGEPEYNFEFSFDFGEPVSNKSPEKRFVEKAMAEIDRCVNMDGWMPSYQNSISIAAIEGKELLAGVGTIDLSPAEVIPLTEPDRSERLRVSAFSALLSIPDIYRKPEHRNVLRYVFATARHDPSAFVRYELLKLIGESIGKISMRKSGADKDSAAAALGSFMIVEETGGEVAAERQEEFRRSNIAGCVDIAREQFSENEMLQRGLLGLLSAAESGVLAKRMVIDICAVLYETRPVKLVTLKIPDRKQVVAKNLGKGKVKLYRVEKPRPKPVQKIKAVAATAAGVAAPPTATDTATVTADLQTSTATTTAAPAPAPAPAPAETPLASNGNAEPPVAISQEESAEAVKPKAPGKIRIKLKGL
ncbi:hypothetical protein BZA70DRAFT_282869 [Myxozyma melibiosi]|uniref:Transcription initiation factor TFIID subunit 2 n=1 Tax=Myxozyma melibiosi TaxID=54550 RepID=A0ABR1F3F0_9ASCO